MTSSDEEDQLDPVQKAILWAPDRPSVHKVYNRRNGDEVEITPEEWSQFLNHCGQRGVCLRLNRDRYIEYDGSRYRLDGQPYPNRIDGLTQPSVVPILHEADSVEAVLIEDSPFSEDDDPEIRAEVGGESA